MQFIRNYFKKTSKKRIIAMFLGNIFLGLGIAIFKFAGLGNDPFSGMVMALADVTKIEYATIILPINLVLFIIELLFGIEFVGLGTVINAFLLGYIVTGFYWMITHVFHSPNALPISILIMLIGTLFTGFGCSLYQTPNVGTAPYDSLSIIIHKKLPKISYFWERIFTDAVCALICFLAGGIVGLGTLVSAFGLGPVISFFNKHFSCKVLAGEDNILKP